MKLNYARLADAAAPEQVDYVDTKIGTLSWKRWSKCRTG